MLRLLKKKYALQDFGLSSIAKRPWSARVAHRLGLKFALISDLIAMIFINHINFKYSIILKGNIVQLKEGRRLLVLFSKYKQPNRGCPVIKPQGNYQSRKVLLSLPWVLHNRAIASIPRHLFASHWIRIATIIIPRSSKHTDTCKWSGHGVAGCSAGIDV